MNIRVSKTAAFDTRIVFVTKTRRGLPRDMEGGAQEVAVRYEKGTTVIYCGLGETKGVTGDIVRSQAARGMQQAAALKRARVSLVVPALRSVDALEACVSGAVLGGYAFTKFKSETRDEVKLLEIVGTGIPRRQVAALKELSDSVCFSRDLVNDNAGNINPERLAREARRIARGTGMRCTVLDENAIERKGLGLLKAVGQASPFPPRLILLEYRGAPRSGKKTALVGKGITFDSGGQNLKPSGHIETMRCDMAGAAAVLGAMRAVSRLKPRVNVVGVIPAAHNAIGNSAYFPGDVYTSYAGKTVEISNTDAEGRLVLADAIAYVIKNRQPTELIDLATLTGGVLIALGDTVAGLFSNNDLMAEQLARAGERTGERLWRLPVYSEHGEAMKSDIADLRNTAKLPRGHASSITGAAFLKEFVGDTPWAHIDIAGTAFNDREPRGEVPRFGTGFGVRLVYDYLTGS